MEDKIEVNKIVVDETTSKLFLEIAKWCKFLSVMGFISMGLMLIIGIAMFISGFYLSSFNQTPVAMWAIGLVYILIAGIYLVPIYYFFKFSTSIKQSILSNNQSEFNTGITFLKSHFKFIGIFTIVSVAIYILVFVGAMLLPFFLR